VGEGVECRIKAVLQASNAAAAAVQAWDVHPRTPGDEVGHCAIQMSLNSAILTCTLTAGHLGQLCRWWTSSRGQPQSASMT
jgi:hypothetical protein